MNEMRLELGRSSNSLVAHVKSNPWKINLMQAAHIMRPNLGDGDLL